MTHRGCALKKVVPGVVPAHSTFGCHNTVIQMFFVAWNIKHNMNIYGPLQKPA